jgi:FlaA1/EpsC-like NDP-sugar epimerase
MNRSGELQGGGAENDSVPPLRNGQLRQRLYNRPAQVILDMLVLVMAFWIAYELRFEFTLSEQETQSRLWQTPLVVLIQFAALFIAGVYAFIWRYIGMAEITAFIKAAFWSGLVLLILRLGLTPEFHVWRVPISIIVMTTAFGVGGVLCLRVLRRAIYERFEKRAKANGGNGRRSKPVLLVGAGRAGMLAAREIQNRGDLGLEIRGFVDDDGEKLGSVIQGVKVLGTSRDLPRLVSDLGVDHVIITIAQASRLTIRRIIEICEQIPIKARIIPGYYEIVGGQVELSRIRDVEIVDLLGREPVHLDQEILVGFLKGKTVMVTGAGGSIGAELTRQVARFDVGSLLLVERAEFALFDIDRELRQRWPELHLVPLVADICDRPRMESIFTEHRPSVVLHAAAHKHVPMMEINPTEAVKNNILATRLLGELAGSHGAGAFIQISTDKAVRPSSIMGASKRIAELAVQALDPQYATRFVSVRFGNVLGSAGSVVPIFREQILNGGPVTVTHPDMVRYFMTISEAAQLVLQAGAMGAGGEIFVLDMGEPVRILDMAKDMISLFGLKPYEDIDIVFSGMRPGEKLFEELQIDGEKMSKTKHPKIFIGRINTYPEAEVDEALTRLQELSAPNQENELRAYLNQLLPEGQIKA